MHPLSDVEFFKANEFNFWLFYVGPLLLREKAPAAIFERFSLSSFAIRLLMMSSKYTVEAEDLIQLFLEKI